MDAIHVRLLLEPEVKRLAAKHISPEQLRSLWDAQSGLEAAVAAQIARPGRTPTTSITSS